MLSQELGFSMALLCGCCCNPGRTCRSRCLELPAPPLQCLDYIISATYIVVFPSFLRVEVVTSEFGYTQTIHTCLEAWRNDCWAGGCDCKDWPAAQSITNHHSTAPLSSLHLPCNEYNQLKAGHFLLARLAESASDCAAEA